MDKTFVEGLDKEPITEDALEQLEALATSFQAVEEDVARLEGELKTRKEQLNKLSQEAIPELLHQYGISEIKLRNKKKIIVSENVSVSVPDEKREAFLQFLKDNKAEDLVKLQFAFDRMPTAMHKQLFDFLNSNEYEYKAKEDVHPQTLKKYFKDILGIGLDEDEREEGRAQGILLKPQDVEKAVNLFTFFSTKIKD